MPWNNAWSGGGGVVASSVKVVDANGNVVASIDGQGNIVGANLNIANNIFYQGEELAQVFQQFAFGRITSAFLSHTAGPFSTTGAEKMLLQTQFTYNKSRSTFIYVRPFGISFAGNTTPAAVRLIIRAKLATGGNVTPADPGIIANEIENNIAGYAPSIDTLRECNFAAAPWNFPDGSVINVALSFDGFNNAGANGPVATVGDDIYMVVADMGTQTNPGNTVNLYVATPPPSQVWKTFEKIAFDSQSYQQNGNASSGSGATQQTNMYFGQDPAYAPNGNWRSYCWFDGAAGGGNGLGSLTDVVGVPAGQLSFLDVFVYAEWFYFIAGGTLYVGMTGTSPNHSHEPGATYQLVPITYSGRGQGQWVSIMGTAMETAVLNGTFSGFVLGPGPTTSLQYYGYADGAVRAQPIRIRGGYYK